MKPEPEKSETLRRIEARCARIAAACVGASWVLAIAIFLLVFFAGTLSGDHPGLIVGFFGILIGYLGLLFFLYRLSSRWEYRAVGRYHRWRIVLALWGILVVGALSVFRFQGLGLFVLIPELVAGPVILYGGLLSRRRWRLHAESSSVADSAPHE